MPRSPCGWTVRAWGCLQDGNHVRRGRMAASGAVSGIVGECPMAEGDDDDEHGIPKDNSRADSRVEQT